MLAFHDRPEVAGSHVGAEAGDVVRVRRGSGADTDGGIVAMKVDAGVDAVGEVGLEHGGGLVGGEPAAARSTCGVAMAERSSPRRWAVVSSIPHGVAAFCALHGLDPNAVMAIGDGPNDADLLENAAIAVVPDDAHLAAQRHADHVVGAARDGGWADILHLLDLTLPG